MESLKERARLVLKSIKETHAVGYYGISCLDDFLHGIYKDDLVIITAQSGAGKTEIAFNLAYNNARNKKVLLYALEADTYEPDKRFLYKIIYELYLKDNQKKYQTFSYRNYVHNKLDIEKYFDKAINIFAESQKPDIVYYDTEFTIDSFKQSLLSTKTDYDLIVLDHLDYFDVEENVTENQQMGNIMKELRILNQKFKKPVIAVSHLRKGARKTLMPTIDDLMGSSNKAKIATTVITLAPDKENYAMDGMYPTYFSVQKSRLGTSGNMLMKQVFNSNKNSYEMDYMLMSYNQYEDKAEILTEDKYPKWYKSKDITPWYKQGSSEIFEAEDKVPW